jgi:cyclopropane fatty-acyl-phospholipid synthase-like methyltransferase
VDVETPDDQLLRALPHLQLTWNTPLSIAHADRLLATLKPAPDACLVDLGCGWGGLLLRALANSPTSTGEGIDQNAAHLDRARWSAQTQGLGQRVRFVLGDIVQYRGKRDRVICIGADHAWGSASAALSRLRPRVEPEGRLLFGCGFWTRPPSPKLTDMFGNLPPSLEAVQESAESSGWTVISTDSASTDEWDEFESTWNQDLNEIAKREPHTPGGLRAGRLAKERREEYERGYRGVLGFAYLILAR